MRPGRAGLAAVVPCPERRRHTKAPTEYHAWHAWAEQKMKTHIQVRCPGCGLWAIWVKKTVGRIPARRD